MAGVITGKMKLFSQQNKNLFKAGLTAFQTGDYYEAHEHWEELWPDPSLPDRQCVHGLIQVAVSLFQARQDNLIGAGSMMDKAMVKFSKAPENWNSIKLNDFVGVAKTWQEHIPKIMVVDEIDNTFKPKIEVIVHD